MPHQCSEIVFQQMADAVNGDIGWRVRRLFLGIVCIVTLQRLHCRYAVAPDFFTAASMRSLSSTIT